MFGVSQRSAQPIAALHHTNEQQQQPKTTVKQAKLSMQGQPTSWQNDTIQPLDTTSWLIRP
jgi:hypothetical protein